MNIYGLAIFFVYKTIQQTCSDIFVFYSLVSRRKWVSSGTFCLIEGTFICAYVGGQAKVNITSDFQGTGWNDIFREGKTFETESCCGSSELFEVMHINSIDLLCHRAA